MNEDSGARYFEISPSLGSIVCGPILSSATFSCTSISVRIRKAAMWAMERPCSILLLRENRSFLDHSLPSLKFGCSIIIEG